MNDKQEKICSWTHHSLGENESLSGKSKVAQVVSSKLTGYRCISHASFAQHNNNEDDVSFLAEFCCEQRGVLPHYYSQPWNKLSLSHYCHTVKNNCSSWHSVGLTFLPLVSETFNIGARGAENIPKFELDTASKHIKTSVK